MDHLREVPGQRGRHVQQIFVLVALHVAPRPGHAAPGRVLPRVRRRPRAHDEDVGVEAPVAPHALRDGHSQARRRVVAELEALAERQPPDRVQVREAREVSAPVQARGRGRVEVDVDLLPRREQRLEAVPAVQRRVACVRDQDEVELPGGEEDPDHGEDLEAGHAGHVGGVERGEREGGGR